MTTTCAPPAQPAPTDTIPAPPPTHTVWREMMKMLSALHQRR